MTEGSTRLYEFGDFRLDRGKRLLLRHDGAIVPLAGKAYEIRNPAKGASSAGIRMTIARRRNIAV